MKINRITAISVVLLLLAGGYLYKKYRIAPSLLINSLQLTHLNGETVSIDELRNKPIIINFYATWCGPCMAEMPDLALAATRLQKEGIECICISDEPIHKIETLAQRRPWPFTFYRSAEKLNTYGIHTIPTTYVIDAKGNIVFKNVGIYPWSDEATINTFRKLLQ